MSRWYRYGWFVSGGNFVLMLAYGPWWARVISGLLSAACAAGALYEERQNERFGR